MVTGSKLQINVYVEVSQIKSSNLLPAHLMRVGSVQLCQVSMFISYTTGST